MTCNHQSNPQWGSDITYCRLCGKPHWYRQWELVQWIGSGSFAHVYLGKSKQREAIIKIYKDDIALKDRLIEIRNLYIAALFHTAPMPIEASEYAVVMEYVARTQGLGIKEDIKALLESLNRLHNRGLVHRDIKPENIIRTAGGTRIIDYGIMVDITKDFDAEVYGTPGYVPQEGFNPAIPVSSKLDSYAAGIVLSLWLGAPPSSGDMTTFGLPQGWTSPQEYHDLLQGLTMSNPFTRWTCGRAFSSLLPTIYKGLGIDLVTAKEYQNYTGLTCQENHGYAVGLTIEEMEGYCRATNTTLPSLQQLKQCATGIQTEHKRLSANDQWDNGLISDSGHRHLHYCLWQPTLEGVCYGGSWYVSSTVQTIPFEPNSMVGFRVATF